MTKQQITDEKYLRRFEAAVALWGWHRLPGCTLEVQMGDFGSRIALAAKSPDNVRHGVRFFYRWRHSPKPEADAWEGLCQLAAWFRR